MFRQFPEVEVTDLVLIEVADDLPRPADHLMLAFDPDDDRRNREPFGCPGPFGAPDVPEAGVSRFIDVCYVSDRRCHRMDRRCEEPDPDSAAQLERFKEAARALGGGEDGAAFRDKLRVIARHQPKDAPKRTKAVPNEPD